jgi:nucleoside-diphosphate-sugar epimerase
MRILVTGSDGFIGSHLVPLLYDREHEISVLLSDLREHSKVRDEVLLYDPEVIVHLAARTEVEKSFYEQVTFSEINYVGTVNLIEVARELKSLKNFCFASTMEVYGWQHISDYIKGGGVPAFFAPFDEYTPPNPNAPYSVAKYACEKYLEYANRSYGLPFTALRQTNTYGRKDNDFFVTEQIITQMLKNPTEIHLGYPDPYRNFLYIDDLMGAWVTVVENPEKVAGEIFCLGPDEPICIRDYAWKIAGMIGWNGTIHWNTKPARPGEIYYLNSTNEKITRATGWAPTTTLDEGLKITIDYWRQAINGNQN